MKKAGGAVALLLLVGTSLAGWACSSESEAPAARSSDGGLDALRRLLAGESVPEVDRAAESLTTQLTANELTYVLNADWRVLDGRSFYSDVVLTKSLRVVGTAWPTATGAARSLTIRTTLRLQADPPSSCDGAYAAAEKAAADDAQELATATGATCAAAALSLPTIGPTKAAKICVAALKHVLEETFRVPADVQSRAIAPRDFTLDSQIQTCALPPKVADPGAGATFCPELSSLSGRSHDEVAATGLSFVWDSDRSCVKQAVSDAVDGGAPTDAGEDAGDAGAYPECRAACKSLAKSGCPLNATEADCYSECVARVGAKAGACSTQMNALFACCGQKDLSSNCSGDSNSLGDCAKTPYCPAEGETAIGCCGAGAICKPGQ